MTAVFTAAGSVQAESVAVCDFMMNEYLTFCKKYGILKIYVHLYRAETIINEERRTEIYYGPSAE